MEYSVDDQMLMPLSIVVVKENIIKNHLYRVVEYP